MSFTRAGNLSETLAYASLAAMMRWLALGYAVGSGCFGPVPVGGGVSASRSLGPALWVVRPGGGVQRDKPARLREEWE